MPLTDIADGWKRRSNWAYLAYSDLKHNYNRTLLGPLWASLQWGLTIVIKGFVFALIFKVELASYLPFLTAGLLLWQWMSNMMTQGVTVFITNRAIIESISMPMSFHVFRSVFFLFLYFCNHMVVFAIVAVVFRVAVSTVSFLAIGGVALIYLSGLCVVAAFGVAGARIRDVIPLVGALVNLGFFVTPIMWQREMLGARTWIADWNPLYHYIELVRAPLLGHAPAELSWWVAGGCTAGLLLVALAVFGRYRKQIPYWL